MPNSQDPKRKHDRRELQGPKELLIRRHTTKQSLRRLCQTEHCPKIHEKTGNRHCKYKHIFASGVAPGVDVFAKRNAEQQQDEQKHGKGYSLHRQAGEQNIITRIGIFPIRFRGSDQGRASYLHNGRQNISRDEAPQY